MNNNKPGDKSSGGKINEVSIPITPKVPDPRPGPKPVTQLPNQGTGQVIRRTPGPDKKITQL